MLSRTAHSLVQAILFSLGIIFVLSVAWATDRWMAAGIARSLVNSLGIGLALTLFGGGLSYRKYVAANGGPLSAPPNWLTRGRVAILAVFACAAMVVAYRVGLRAKSDFEATVAILAFVGIPVVVLFLALLERDWRHEREKINGQSGRPAV
jgi:hypothetical protein